MHLKKKKIIRKTIFIFFIKLLFIFDTKYLNIEKFEIFIFFSFILYS